MLGLVAEDEEGADAEAEDDGEINDEEVFIFPGSCSSCGHALDTKMKKVNIPYFQVRSYLLFLLHVCHQAFLSTSLSLILTPLCPRC